MMQGLASKITRCGFILDGRRLEITQAKLEVLQTISPGFAPGAQTRPFFPELSTAITLVARRASNSLSNPSPDPRSATTSRGSNRRRSCPRGLPGPAGTVTAVKPPGDLVKIKLGLVAPSRQNPFKSWLGQTRAPAFREPRGQPAE